MMDIRNFFAKDKGKDTNPKQPPPKKQNAAEFPDPDQWDQLFSEPRRNPSGAVWDSDTPNRLLAFSLPSVFKNDQKGGEKKSEKLLEDVEDISDDEFQVPLRMPSNDDDVVFVGCGNSRKRKFAPDEEETYSSWKKRHYFQSAAREKLSGSSDQTNIQYAIKRRIQKQEQVIGEWRKRVEHCKEQLERTERSLAHEIELLQQLKEKQESISSPDKDKCPENEATSRDSLPSSLEDAIYDQIPSGDELENDVNPDHNR